MAIAWPSEGVRTAESGKSGGEKEEGAEDGMASPDEPNVQTGGVPEVDRRMSVALDPAASRTGRIHGAVAAACVAPLVLTVGMRLRTGNRTPSRRSAGGWRRSPRRRMLPTASARRRVKAARERRGRSPRRPSQPGRPQLSERAAVTSSRRRSRRPCLQQAKPSQMLRKPRSWLLTSEIRRQQWRRAPRTRQRSWTSSKMRWKPRKENLRPSPRRSKRPRTRSTASSRTPRLRPRKLQTPRLQQQKRKSLQQLPKQRARKMQRHLPSSTRSTVWGRKRPQ